MLPILITPMFIIR